MIGYWLDWIAKLLPAAAIIVAVFVARMQLRAARRATAMTIAKNHYRKMLAIFQENTDILYSGTSAESLEALKKERDKYLRYRMLFTNMSFACQELFLVVDIEKDKHWANTLRIFSALFGGFINSDEFSPTMQATLHPKFLAFMKEAAGGLEHPAATIMRQAKTEIANRGSSLAQN
jgi:hypothetical protein